MFVNGLLSKTLEKAEKMMNFRKMIDKDYVDMVAKLPEFYKDQQVAYGSRQQFKSVYGREPLNNEEFFENKIGYLPPGSTVAETYWERQQNGPMTIITEGDGIEEPIYPVSAL